MPARTAPIRFPEHCKLFIRRRILHPEHQYRRHALPAAGTENPDASVPLLFRGIEREVRLGGNRPAEPTIGGGRRPASGAALPFALFPSLPLVSRASENMSDFYSPPHFSVVNEILSGRKAPCAWFDVITRPPGFRVLSEQPEALYNRIDQSVCNIQACPFCPICKYLVQIVLRLVRDAVALHAFGALPASTFLPRDLTPAAKCPRPSLPTESVYS